MEATIELTPHAGNAGFRRRHGFSVLAIFRNEAHILAEWIEHYLLFGAEHIYLINNRSTDGYMAALAPHLARGEVSLFDCEAEGCQIAAYTAMLARLREESEWVGIFDLDEFIYPPSGGVIPELLARHRMQESILVPWLSFGSSGHLDQPASVVDGFLRRGPGHVSRAFLKPIVKPSSIVHMCQHNPLTRHDAKILANGQPFGHESFIALHEDEVAQFALLNNHYRLQSRHYFVEVKARRPEIHESVKDTRKKVSFFDKNDAGWSVITDTRLRDLREAAQRFTRSAKNPACASRRKP